MGIAVAGEDRPRKLKNPFEPEKKRAGAAGSCLLLFTLGNVPDRLTGAVAHLDVTRTARGRLGLRSSAPLLLAIRTMEWDRLARQLLLFAEGTTWGEPCDGQVVAGEKG